MLVAFMLAFPQVITSAAIVLTTQTLEDSTDGKEDKSHRDDTQALLAPALHAPSLD